MLEISKIVEVAEAVVSDTANFKEIKPEGSITPDLAKKYIEQLFDEKDNIEKTIEKELNEYFDDLKNKSECPDTIADKPFDSSELKTLTPEENAKMREEFDDKKNQLKHEWEIVNGRSWPKYECDVYSANGKLIRKAGSDYDAHHIHPLSLGGKNEVSNITPLNAEVHYDKQGIHSPDSPYNKICQILGEMNI